MSKMIWLGIRESDIADTGQIFSGSITLFGSGTDNNRSMERETGCRIDHNGECPGYDTFFEGALRETLADLPDARFIQYDPLDCAHFPQELQEKFIFQNEYELLQRLNNKIALKQELEGILPVLPYVLLKAGDCTKEHLQQAFPFARAVVVQRTYSCGGSGTFCRSLSQDERLPIPNDEQCMVTAFQEHSVSVNIHCVIYQQEAVLFPPSVQIIDDQGSCLAYMGSDFSAYWQLPEIERDLVKTTARTACRWLQEQGYLGVCGIDMLLAGGGCFLMEINPRFQASSAMLNRGLVKNGSVSVQAYHCDAFCSPRCTLGQPPLRIDGSFVTLHYHPEDRCRLMWFHQAVSSSPHFFLCDDGLCWEHCLEDGCYAFQLQCNTALSSITFQHAVRLHPNTSLSAFRIKQDATFDNILRLKLLLLSRGVSITPTAWDAAERLGGIDWAEFSAVTLRLFNKIWVTAPCMDPWYDLSPLQVDAEPEGSFFLRYYGEPLVTVEVMPKDPRSDHRTSEGHFYRDVVYLNPDRLRIYHRDGCELQAKGIGCQFCDLFGTGTDISFSEISEVLECYWDDPRVEHYLIGGGSGWPTDHFDRFIQIAKYLRTHSDKHIYLMSHPIEDFDILQKLRSSGVTEVAFNIEIFNDAIARSVMPGKAQHTRDAYLRALSNAVSVFGSDGAVRCAILVGFDEPSDFELGIRKICETGADPMLSLFRPGLGTPMESYMPVNEEIALAYYNSAEAICKEYARHLGPSCKACQNNTIALDF